MKHTHRVNMPFIGGSEPTPEQRAVMLLNAIEHVRNLEGDLRNVTAKFGSVKLPATEVAFGYQQVVVTWDEDDE